MLIYHSITGWPFCPDFEIAGPVFESPLCSTLKSRKSLWYLEPSTGCWLSNTWTPPTDVARLSSPCSAWSLPASCPRCRASRRPSTPDRSETQRAASSQSWRRPLSDVPRTDARASYRANVRAEVWRLAWRTARLSILGPRIRSPGLCRRAPTQMVKMELIF